MTQRTRKRTERERFEAATRSQAIKDIIAADKHPYASLEMQMLWAGWQLRAREAKRT